MAASFLRVAAAPSAGVVAGPQISLALRASGLSNPDFVTSARDGTGRLFIVEQTGKIKIYDERHGALDAVPRIARQVSKGGEQGLLGPRLPPELQVEPQALRGLHGHQRRHGGPRVPGVRARTRTSWPPARPARSSRSPSRSPTTTAACSRSARTATCTSAWATAAAAATPATGRRTRTRCSARCCASTSTARTGHQGYRDPVVEPVRRQAGAQRDLADRGLRNPWRFSFDRANRQPVDRRRRPGHVGGDRPRVRTPAGRRGVNWGWRAMEGFHCYSPSTRLQHGGQGAAAARVRPQRRALRGDRRLRVPRHADPGAARRLRVRRLLQRRDLDASARPPRSPATPTLLLDIVALDLVVRREPVREAVRRRPRRRKAVRDRAGLISGPAAAPARGVPSFGTCPSILRRRLPPPPPPTPSWPPSSAARVPTSSDPAAVIRSARSPARSCSSSSRAQPQGRSTAGSLRRSAAR